MNNRNALRYAMGNFYNDSPVVTAVFTDDLKPVWINKAAEEHYPFLFGPNGVKMLLNEDQTKLLQRHFEALQPFSQPIGLGDKLLTLTPGNDEDGTFWLLHITSDSGWMTAKPSFGGGDRVINSINYGLRAPLSKVFSGLSAIERIADVEGDEELDKLVGYTNDSAYSALRSLQNVSDYVGLVYGANEKTDERFELTVTLKKLMEACSMMTRKIGIPISCELPENEFEVGGRMEALMKAILQLIDNSCRYSRPGNTIEVTAEYTERYAKVTLCDHGEGIESDRLEDAMIPYYSFDPNGSQSCSVGLGLPIAKAYINELGGTLAITSKKGQGTVAAIRLPRAKSTVCPPSQEGPQFNPLDSLRDRFSPVQVILSESCGAPKP